MRRFNIYESNYTKTAKNLSLVRYSIGWSVLVGVVEEKSFVSLSEFVRNSRCLEEKRRIFSRNLKTKPKKKLSARRARKTTTTTIEQIFSLAYFHFMCFVSSFDTHTSQSYFISLISFAVDNL